MALADELVDITVKAVPGVIIGCLGTLVIFWVQGFFDARKEKVTEAKKSTENLAVKVEESYQTLSNAVADLKIRVEQAYSNLKDKVNDVDRHTIEKLAEVNTRIAVLSTNLDKYRQDITKIEGKLEHNSEMAASHIASINHMSRQLDAIFRIVDAPERTSDKTPLREEEC